MRFRLLFSLLCSLLILACKPKPDQPGPTDSRLDRPYCNDPEAVNYNWDFPGKPDNSVCRYPAEVLAGHWLLVDSAIAGDGRLSVYDTFDFRLLALARNKLVAVDLFCPGDSIYLTAGRFFRAEIDTQEVLGQKLRCGTQDTVAGYVARSINDSTRLQVYSTFYTPSGTFQHRGTAIRQ